MADSVLQEIVWTPEEWFVHLMKKFDADLTRDPRAASENTPKTRRERLELLMDYYIGDPPLPYVNDTYKSTFKEVQRKARSNYATMCVDVMTDRSVLQGVTTESDNDIDGDDLARKIQAASGFAAVQRDVQTYLFTLGEAYVTVVPPAEGTGEDAVPMMIAEDPRRCVGQVDPANPTRLMAAVKYYDDELRDCQIALLFVENQQYTFVREEGQYSTSFNEDEWSLAGSMAVPGLELLGGVPIVRFQNKLGLGEFEPHVDLLDRIMDGIFQRIVIQWYQSFKQRAVIGDLDGGEDFTDADDSNNLIRSLSDDSQIADLFQADPGALWLVPDGVTFWESNQADLTPLTTAIRDDVKEFAASTRTPLHIITPDAANGSAEGASLMREGLVDKINDRRLGRRLAGRSRSRSRSSSRARRPTVSESDCCGQRLSATRCR
ncbi:phage portal protein [Rhodococcus hoagii]|nr:phage portal protein [Prescottella equi]